MLRNILTAINYAGPFVVAIALAWFSWEGLKLALRVRREAKARRIAELTPHEARPVGPLFPGRKGRVPHG